MGKQWGKTWGKQGRKGNVPTNVPTLEMTYWDADWGDEYGPMIGAHFDAASAVTIWARSPLQIAEFLDWLFTRAEASVNASDDARRASGSLRGEFDFTAMGMQVAKIDGSICVNVPGQFVGLMVQAPSPQAFLPFMRLVLQAVLDKRKRAGAN